MIINAIDLTYVLGGALQSPQPELPVPWPRSKREPQLDPAAAPRSEPLPQRPPLDWLPIPTRPDPWQ
jgi:hypothetical protein